MNNAALARHLESELLEDLSAESAPQPAYRPSLVVTLPPQPTAAPRGVLQRLWLFLFGPPAIEQRTAPSDFGVFRALYEIGSDHLPSSGTWPAP